MTERLFTCDAPLPVAGYADLAESFVEVEAKILETGRKVQRGGAGEFEITAEQLEEMVRNHEADLAAGYEPPAVIGHPSKRDEAPAVGWIKKLRAAADGLYARVQFLGDFAARVKAGEYRYSSPSFAFNWHDEEGRARGAKLLDLGILNNPFQKRLGAFALSEIEADAGSADLQPSLPGVGDGPEDHTMSDKTLELTEKVANLTRDLDEKTTEATALSEQVQTLTDERDSLTAKLSEAESARDEAQAKVDTIQREKDAAEIASVLKVALHEGKFAPAQVKGHGTDDFDGLTWLSESPFRDLAALKSFIKTAPRVVDLGERSSAPSSGDASDADKSKQVQQAAEAALAANPSLSREKAVELAEKALA